MKVTTENWQNFHACPKCRCYPVCEVRHVLSKNSFIVVSHCIWFAPNADFSENEQKHWSSEHGVILEDE